MSPGFSLYLALRGLGLQSLTGNLGVWGSNPGDGEQNFGRGQIEWRKATGNHLIYTAHSLVIGLAPLDLPK